MNYTLADLRAAFTAGAMFRHMSLFATDRLCREAATSASFRWYPS